MDFAGYVTRQSGDEWRISGITVFITSETRLPDQLVAIGSAVRVHGRIQDGGVLAGEVELLPAGSRLPEVEDDELEIEQEKPEELKPEDEGESDSGSVVEATVVPIVPSSTPEVEPEDVSLEGVVSSIENDLIVINGIVMDIQFAEVDGSPSVGSFASVEGYYDASGVFIVIKIEFQSSGSGGGVNDNSSGGDNSNDTGDDSNSNDNNVNDDNSNDDDDNSNNDNGNGD